MKPRGEDRVGLGPGTADACVERQGRLGAQLLPALDDELPEPGVRNRGE